MRLHRGCSPNGATDKFRLLQRATPGATDRELLPRELLPVQQAGSYSRELLPVQQAPGRNPNPLKCLFSKPSQLLLLKLTCELHEPVTASDASQHECFEVADDQVMG